MDYATPLRRLMAHILDGILFFLTLIIGYIIWWLIVLGRGQTPGKQLLGIRAMRRNGSRVGWGRMFVREILQSAIHSISGGLGLLADAILILLDDREHRSLADRVADTVIVHN